MNLRRILRNFVFATALVGVVSTTSSCGKDDPEGSGSFRKSQITGAVTGDDGAALPGVKVSLFGVSSEGVVQGVLSELTTVADGLFAFSDVNVDTYVVRFEKLRHQTINLTVAPSLFKEDGIKTDIRLIIADAKISGTVYDANNANAPLAGVTVSVGAGLATSTGSDGTYTITDLSGGDYTVTFSKEGYPIGSMKITKDQFIDSHAQGINFILGAKELLRGKTINDLKNAEQWYYSDYRGSGFNDWSYTYMCALDFVGRYQHQGEGETLQIRDGANAGDPADMVVFDSYVYGRKLITEDNKILSLWIRTHNSDADRPMKYGVQVIDLTSAVATNVQVGGIREITTGGSDYRTVEFDLSAFAGKEVIVAIGNFRPYVGCENQFVIRRILFTPTSADAGQADAMLPGTGVTALPGWKMTNEMVKSTTINSKKMFTGVNPVTGGNGNHHDGYRAWRGTSHFGLEWGFISVNKDLEPLASEGFIIKTRGGGSDVSTITPASYLYAKFAIADGNNRFAFRTRTMGGNYLFFKFTVIEDNGTVTHISPVSNTATTAEAAADGCWKFKNDRGSTGKPEEYATFNYDLSSFNGKSVVVAIGVFKGEGTGEEKLVFSKLTIN